MESEAEESAQAIGEHRVHVPDAANGDLERAEGGQATRERRLNVADAADLAIVDLDGADRARTVGEHRINIAGADLANGDLERGDRARVAGENRINGTDAVRVNGNVGGRAVSRNLISRILYLAGPVIVVISAVLLISVPLGLNFRHQIFVGSCFFFLGMMLIFLAVHLS